MKLSTYARQIGVTYKTAYRWWKAGKLDAYQLDTGTVIVRDPLPRGARGVALYARVSSVDQKSDLERQMERLKDYAAAHGYQVTRMVQEIGSGLNDRRPKFLKLLTDPSIGVIILEHQIGEPAVGLSTLSNCSPCRDAGWRWSFPRTPMTIW